MATKGKKPRAVAVQHLNDAQYSELPGVAREFLFARAGGQEAALLLNQKKLKEIANDFLYSEEGNVYWCNSKRGQWEYGASVAEVEKWIAELMARERSHQDPQESTIVVDDPMEGPSSGKKFEASIKARTKTPKKIPALKSPVRIDQDSRNPKHPASPTQDAASTTVRFSKSPTAAPDIPNANEPETPRPATRKSIRPTPESVKIAYEKFADPVMAEINPSREAQGSPRVGLGLKISPKTSRKRVAAESVDDEAGMLNPIATERQAKRATLGSMVSPRIAGVAINSQVEDFGLLASRASEATALSAPEPPGNRLSPRTDDSNEAEPRMTRAAYGLSFTTDNLLEVPEKILGYITECEHHQIRLANETDDPSLKREHRARSTLFQHMRADLESRIMCLAQDAEEKGQVESSHCMWS